MRHFTKLLILVLLLASSAFSQSFTMNEQFLRRIINANTAQPSIRVRMKAHGPLHPLDQDCEMHVAGTVIGGSIGTPPAIVVEFPNWCEFNPQGNLGDNLATLKQKWNTFATSNLDNKTCDVTGFLRIFTEHASGGGGATNPDHAYELHPALSMKCGSQTFNFGDMLRASPGLRHISNGAASSCITGRKLKVKFAHNRYEFTESGGGSCGNFVIIRVSAINAAQSVPMGGGHYTVATVTADGSHSGEVGLYTLADSPLDDWLEQAIGNGGIGSSTKIIHGVFTYNWQSIINTLRNSNGTLRRPAQLVEIRPSLAVIAYGESSAPF